MLAQCLFVMLLSFHGDCFWPGWRGRGWGSNNAWNIRCSRSNLDNVEPWNAPAAKLRLQKWERKTKVEILIQVTLAFKVKWLNLKWNIQSFLLTSFAWVSEAPFDSGFPARNQCTAMFLNLFYAATCFVFTLFLAFSCFNYSFATNLVFL